MRIETTRRFMLMGAAGAAAVGISACKKSPTQVVEDTGAFPPSLGGEELLGPQPGVALLSRNENPYGPSKSALKMIEYAGKKGAYYAGGAIGKLKDMIAERHGISAEQIAVTTGSGEALSAIALAYGPKGPIVAPRLFWDTTALYAKRMGMAEIQRVPLKDDMSVDIAAIEAAVTPATSLVQLCNPNNPTGMISDPAILKPAVKRMAKKATVLMDEAYMELAHDPEANSCIDLVKDGHDVIVCRTFSKIYGMAGIRVGYTISSPETAALIQQTAMSWISGVGIAAAIGAYNDMAFLDYSKSKIVEGREMVKETVNALGFASLPSHTNFVYFNTGKANVIQKALAEKNVMIRSQYMDYSDWNRVSMGKIEDVVRFCKTLPTVVDA